MHCSEPRFGRRRRGERQFVSAVYLLNVPPSNLEPFAVSRFSLVQSYTPVSILVRLSSCLRHASWECTGVEWAEELRGSTLETSLRVT